MPTTWRPLQEGYYMIITINIRRNNRFIVFYINLLCVLYNIIICICIRRLYVSWSSSLWTCFRTSPVYNIMSDDSNNSIIIYTFIHKFIFQILVCIGISVLENVSNIIIPLRVRKIMQELEKGIL